MVGCLSPGMYGWLVVCHLVCMNGCLSPGMYEWLAVISVAVTS